MQSLDSVVICDIFFLTFDQVNFFRSKPNDFMSYNYLPLDSKHTNFQQIKNLLVFDQLVVEMYDISRVKSATDPLGALAAELHGRMMQVSMGSTTGIGAMQAVPRQVRKRLVRLMKNLDSQLKRDVVVLGYNPVS